MRPILALIASTFLFTASAFAADQRAPGLTSPQPLPNQAQPAQPDLPNDAAEPARPARPTPPTAEQLLDRLSKAENPRDARAIEQQLHALWSRSGSATADLLLERSEKALEEEDIDTAQALLEKLTELAPKFAEGWYQRAAIAARSDNFEDAVASLRQVLALQPKHFVALAELGTILEDFGDKQRALEAYRQAQTLNPHIEGLEDRIRELSREVEGQGI
jgi:tetratricopeptide (TPR) repeat protein